MAKHLFAKDQVAFTMFRNGIREIKIITVLKDRESARYICELASDLQSGDKVFMERGEDRLFISMDEVLNSLKSKIIAFK